MSPTYRCACKISAVCCTPPSLPVIAECITKCMAHGGVPVEGDNVSITCPNKCSQPTVIPQGNVQNLPKNFAVLEIINGSRERMQFLQSRWVV